MNDLFKQIECNYWNFCNINAGATALHVDELRKHRRSRGVEAQLFGE